MNLFIFEATSLDDIADHFDKQANYFKARTTKAMGRDLVGLRARAEAWAEAAAFLRMTKIKES